jgi:3-oxoacyl-[acyl-carrier protein] reductase
MEENNLKNKVALITGGSRGIGAALALSLAEEGIKVAVNYHHSEKEALAICEEIEKKGGKAIAIQADVSEAAAVEKLVKTTRETLGPIDILINNAGISKGQSIEESTEQDFDEIIKVNLKSTFLVTQAVLPEMRERKWGRIVMMSSVAAQTGGVVSMQYAASKAGQIAMMHYLARRLATEGITVNAIAPVIIETDMIQNIQHLSKDIIPVKRFGKTSEVTDIVLLLLKNSYITNQTINVNGGMHPS